MDWPELLKMAAVAILGGGAAGLAAMLRIRGQNARDKADASQLDATADAARATAFANLWEHVNKASAEYDRKLKAAEACYADGIERVRAELQADIEAKDIRLKRLEMDVIALKQKLGEWRAYAMGLYDMLVKLKETPPPPPATGPLG